MGERTWRGRIGALWRSVRRMFVGAPRGATVRLVERGDVGKPERWPVISIVLGQWPADRAGDAVLSDRLGREGIRRAVAAVGRSGLSGVVWRVHGVETIPRSTDWVARWLVALAESAGGGAVEVDVAGMGERECEVLDAQLRRWGRKRRGDLRSCV